MFVPAELSGLLHVFCIMVNVVLITLLQQPAILSTIVVCVQYHKAFREMTVTIKG